MRWRPHSGEYVRSGTYTCSCGAGSPDRTADELEDELATLSAHLAAGMCRWLELVAELDRRGGFAAEGAGSCSEWLSWRCAVSPRSAREHVRVARSLGELPLIHTAFAGGELSYAKVRALSRVATPESEEALLEVARLQTAAQLERTVRAYRRVSLREAREQQDAAQLAVFWNGEIEPVPRLPRGDPAELTGRNRHLRIDARTCEPGLGERLDLALAVDDMLAIERKATRARAAPVAA